MEEEYHNVMKPEFKKYMYLPTSPNGQNVTRI